MTSDQLRRQIWAAIEPYRRFLIDLVEGRMTADQFETVYLAAYLGHDDSSLSDDVFAVVDSLFYDVDAYVGDPELRPRVDGAIGPEELRERARELLQKAGHNVEAAHPA